MIGKKEQFYKHLGNTIFYADSSWRFYSDCLMHQISSKKLLNILFLSFSKSKCLNIFLKFIIPLDPFSFGSNNKVLIGADKKSFSRASDILYVSNKLGSYKRSHFTFVLNCIRGVLI